MDEIEMKYRPKVRYWIPAGMIECVDLRKDVRDLCARGFGSIEVVSFTLFGIDPPEDYEWNSEPFIQGLIALLDEARKCHMKVDIANGPAWPIAMPGIKNADDLGTSYEITYGISYDQQLPEPKVKHNEGKVELVAVYKYKEVSDHLLDETTYVDLLPYVHNDHIDYPINENEVVFAWYTQPSTQKVNGMYVIDHLSKEGTKHCEDYWLNHLYPRIQEYKDVLENIFCDSLEYKVAEEWTRGFDQLFIEKYHYDLLPYMCVVGTNLTYPKNDIPNYHFLNQQLEKKVNHDYFALISDLYANEHLARLEEMAQKINMHIRYQVAYNKPFEIGLAASKVGICENEALSRVSIDNLKSMSGAVHLFNRPIYSYECSAEFENAYGQLFEDQLWWIKRSYIGGMNQQVFHGACYNGRYYGKGNIDGHIPNTISPGYEAFGRFCSNYWNRTLDIPAMRYHLDMISKYNQIMQKQHIVDVAFYRSEYLNNGKGGDGSHIVKDNLLLLKNGYDYDFISDELLREACHDQIPYQIIVILAHQSINEQQIKKLQQLKNDIYICTMDPSYPFDYIPDYQCLLEILNQKVYREITYHHPDLIYTVRLKDEKNQYYYFYNGNQVEFGYYPEINPKKDIFHPDTIYPTIKDVFKKRELDITIDSSKYPLILMNDGTYSKIKSEKGRIKLILKENEACIIKMVNLEEYESIQEYDTTHQQMQFIKELSFTNTNYQFVLDDYCFEDHHYERSDEINAGYMINQSEVEVKEDGIYRLDFEHIYDTYTLFIDEKKVQCISEYHPTIDFKLEKGIHQLKLIVYTNLQSMLVKPRDFGVIGKCKFGKVK